MFMLVAAPPSGNLLRATMFQQRRREILRLLVVAVCMISCRRGRAAARYTILKVIRPLSFLLWCIGLRGRRPRDDHLLHAGGVGSRSQRRRIGWRDVGPAGSGGLSSGESEGHLAGEVKDGSDTQLAALGENGRLSAFDKLRELQRRGACCDVTLIVGGRHFKAHKCVLAAQSSPLRAMFDGAFKEGNEDVIELRGVEPSSFALLLHFFYDRNIEISSENVEALLDLSARYGVSLLRRHCCAFVARSTNPSNAFSLLTMADRYDCHKLRRDLLAYSWKCFPVACCEGGSEGFRHLSLALVMEVLKDDRLFAGADGEVKVFWAAVSWLEAEASRRQDGDEVLSHIRFGLVSAKTLAEVVEAHPFVQTKTGKSFVHEAYRYQALPPESRDDFAVSMAARARPRVTSCTHQSQSDNCGGDEIGCALRSGVCASDDEDGDSSDESENDLTGQATSNDGHCEDNESVEGGDDARSAVLNLGEVEERREGNVHAVKGQAESGHKAPKHPGKYQPSSVLPEGSSGAERRMYV